MPKATLETKKNNNAKFLQELAAVIQYTLSQSRNNTAPVITCLHWKLTSFSDLDTWQRLLPRRLPLDQIPLPKPELLSGVAATALVAVLSGKAGGEGRQKAYPAVKTMDKIFRRSGPVLIRGLRFRLDHFSTGPSGHDVKSAE